jgi:hypothetical protein
MMQKELNPLLRLTDPYSGSLERELPLGAWLVPPGLDLQDGWLIYERRPIRMKEQAVIAGIKQNFLFDFSELAEADDARILKYARKFGVLGLCQHEKPLGHITRWPIEGLCTPVGGPVEYKERTEKWRFFSRGFRAVLRISAALHEGKPGDNEDWQNALSLPRAAIRSSNPWEHIAGIINLLMSWSAVHPYWSANSDGTMKIVFISSVHESALFTTLLTELLFAITKTRGVLVCSDCGRLFLPKQPARTGVRRFCGSCGLRAAWRAASKAYRSRRGGEKEKPEQDRKEKL